MKVAFFTQNVVYSTYSGVISGWCHALAANGLESIDVVSIIGDPEDKAFNPFPPQVRHVVLPCGRAARAFLPLRRYLHEVNPDILVTAVININLVALVTTMMSRWRGKLIITHHHPIKLSHKFTWKDNLYAARLLYRFADGSIAICPDVLEDAIRECGLDRSTMTIIPNVLPPAPDIDELAELHPWLGSQRPSGPVFVTVSRLVPAKNIPLLLDAVRSLTENLDTRLLIIGTGPEGANVRAAIASRGLSEHVDMLGFVSSPRPYMRKADAFVLASNEEGFSQVIAEAMGEGLPVVSTDAEGGGPRFVLQDGRYGMLVPMGDAHALADGMTAMADSSVRAKYASLGRERVEDFSPKSVGGKLMGFLEKVLNGSVA